MECTERQIFFQDFSREILWNSMILASCHKRAPVSMVHPVTRWHPTVLRFILSQGGAGSKVHPVTRYVLSHGGASIEVRPVTWWHQYWGSSCHKVGPVLRFILSHCGASIEVHPVTRELVVYNKRVQPCIHITSISWSFWQVGLTCVNHIMAIVKCCLYSLNGYQKEF